MATSYTASDIEVLSGLDPVRRRPGMYTDTTRPNHLAHEVVDNSVDEALAGHCENINVTVYKDGSAQVEDDGRGMPVDIHPKEKISGVELILTRLHAGGKFNDKTYQHSGGLHGVGVSVVNALSKHLECWVRRGGKEYNVSFAGGRLKSKLEVVGDVPKSKTGTTIRFWPDPQYFDTDKFAIPRLKQVLRAKAVLCPNLRVTLTNEITGERDEWFYTGGLHQYLAEELGKGEWLPAETFYGKRDIDGGSLDWAFAWVLESEHRHHRELRQSDSDGRGRHARQWPADGSRRRGARILRVSQSRAARLEAHAGRRLGWRELRAFDENARAAVRGTNQGEALLARIRRDRARRHQGRLCALAQSASRSRRENRHAGDRRTRSSASRTARKSRANASWPVPRCPASSPIASARIRRAASCSLVEGDSAGGSAKQARDRVTQAIMPLRGKILNTWEADTGEVLQSQEVHNISIAIGVDPAASDLSGLRYHKICILADADSDGQHIATLLCALFLRHYRPLVMAGHVYVCMPPLFRIDAGKEVVYALDEAEREKALKRIAAENPRTKPVVTRFKGLGEMNPLQLRETTMAPQTRRLVQMTIDATRQPAINAGHAAGEKARRRPARVARDQGQSGRMF